jgi:D-alanyl-D-alanine dipeptidase
MRKPWSEFAQAASKTYVQGLMQDAQIVAPGDLREMEKHRKKERKEECGGHDPLQILIAYAQDELIYDASDTVAKADRATYAATPRERRVNKFGLSYRLDAPFQLHKTLADIVVGAAIRLYQSRGWTTVLYDGLRTMEGAFNLYNLAHDSDLASGLLALPGQSAHNKGLAVDSMMLDESGREVDMGGHFDHLDMETNSRLYNGDKISEAAKANRLIREAAFLYSAFTQDLLIAPLRNEFWDDRLPENRADLWRVLDSAARCMGMALLSPTDEMLRKTKRQAFVESWENWSYDDFLTKWEELFSGRQQEVKKLFGTRRPPQKEKPEFYHGNFHPIYDRDLREAGKHLTEDSAAA